MHFVVNVLPLFDNLNASSNSIVKSPSFYSCRGSREIHDSSFVGGLVIVYRDRTGHAESIAVFVLEQIIAVYSKYTTVWRT